MMRGRSPCFRLLPAAAPVVEDAALGRPCFPHSYEDDIDPESAERRERLNREDPAAKRETP